MSNGPRHSAGLRGRIARGGLRPLASEVGPRRRCVDGGQSTVELVVLLPVVVLLALAVTQIGVLVQHRVMVTHAAREAARAAAVSGGRIDPSRAAGLRGGLDPSRLEIETRIEGDSVVALVRYLDPTDVPMVGALVPDVRLEAEATMLLEG